MGGLSLWHWVIVAVVVALLFGGKSKLSGVMGDFAKGIKAFKSGMKEEDETAVAVPPAQVSPPASAAAAPASAAAGVADRPRDHV